MAAAFAVPAACGSDPTITGDDVVGDDDGSGDEWDQELAKREFDYNAACASRAATGDLPSITEINEVATPTDLLAKKTAYEARVTEYMSRPTFARQMFLFWRDTFKLGETAETDTAPALAAQLSVENGSYMNLLTQNANNCPTIDQATGVFTPAECPGNAPKAGVLSNPGAMKQFFGNLAFRRVKWVQETFDCTKFPVELDGVAQEVGGPSPYTGAWPFLSIAGRVTVVASTSDVSPSSCELPQSLNHLRRCSRTSTARACSAEHLVPLPLDAPPLAGSTTTSASETRLALQRRPDLPARPRWRRRRCRRAASRACGTGHSARTTSSTRSRMSRSRRSRSSSITSPPAASR
jgi:hypothetical protein